MSYELEAYVIPAYVITAYVITAYVDCNLRNRSLRRLQPAHYELIS